MRRPEITRKTIEKYSRRFDILVAALRELGFAAKKPAASFYCYVKAPVGTKEGRRFSCAGDFSDYLLRTQKKDGSLGLIFD